MTSSKAEALIEFIEARLAEDEQIATAAGARAMEWRSSDDHVTGNGVPYVDDWSGGESTVRYDDETIIQDCGEGAESKHIAHYDPARALSEVVAIRSLVELYGALSAHWVLNADYGFASTTLRTLAAIYSDHPDYQEGWEL